MNRLGFDAEIKALEDAPEGSVEGYGSVFNVRDLGGDVIVPGAFAETLRGRKPLMLYAHDPARPVGVWDEAGEDGVGLRLRGRIATETQLGRETLALVRMGAMRGLSIGYRTRKASTVGGARIIQTADLFEVSLVAMPMNEAARIDAVKAAEMTEREFERAMQDAGFSRSVVRALMRGGWKAVQATQDAGGELYELRALLASRFK